MKTTFLTACLLILSLVVNQAATHTVTTLEDSGVGSLRATLAAAAAGDTVTFASNVRGRLTLTSGEIVIRRAVTIVGPGSKALEITTQGKSRTLSVLSGPLKISGLYFFYGAGLGGALHLKASALITDCVFGNNVGYSYHEYAMPELGAAVYIDGTGATSETWNWRFVRCRFGASNSSGIRVANSNNHMLTLISCQFNHNRQRLGAGGAVYVEKNFIIDNCQFYGCSASNNGGAIYSYFPPGDVQSSGRISNSTFYKNYILTSDQVIPAPKYGGAMATNAADASKIKVDHCTFYDNRVDGYGGGFAGKAVITNSTFTENTSSLERGGGVWGGAILKNVIVAGNRSYANVEPNAPEQDLGGGVISHGHNLVGVYEGIAFNQPGDRHGTSLAPLNARLGSFGLFGGSLMSVPLLPGSPAIDRGGAVAATKDQRGRPRTVDLARVANSSGGNGSDIGAFEVQRAPNHTTDVNLDGMPDFLLFNPATSSSQFWHLSNNIFSSSAAGPSGSGHFGVGEFNGYGKPECLFYDASTGVTRFSAYGRTLTTIPEGHRLVAIADFSGDGQADFLIQNTASRALVFYYLYQGLLMNVDYRPIVNATGKGPLVPSGWNVSGVGDFDRDGQNDLVIENTSNRATQILYLNGATQWAVRNGPSLPTGWTLAGVGDFNQDTRPDYVLTNPFTRQTRFYHMNNYVMVGQVGGPTLPTGYVLAAP